MRVGGVAERLLKEMAGGRWPRGAVLPGAEALAREMQVKTAEVETALSQLQASGHLNVRDHEWYTPTPGLGEPLSVLICIELRTHVYQETADLLVAGLQRAGMQVDVVDLQGLTPGELAAQGLRRRYDVVLMRGCRAFPWPALKHPVFGRSRCVAVLDYDIAERLPQLHQVLIDHALGGRLVAEFLEERGHREVLVAGPGELLAQLRVNNGSCGSAFIRAWEGSGGSWLPFRVEWRQDKPHLLDTAALLQVMEGESAPTALFGLRDADTWAVREALGTSRPELVERLDPIGYGNTPWGLKGSRFSTVDWRVPRLVESVCELIVTLQRHPNLEPKVHYLPPNLVRR